MSKNTNPVVAVDSIQIRGANSLVAGQGQQLTATASYSDGSNHDVTATAVWASTNSSVATVAPGGSVTSKASGQCSITATASGVTGSFQLNVQPALVSIAATPAQPQIAAHTTQQFIATGTYSDSSTRDLTSQVAWTSSDPAVAPISSSPATEGLASGASAGIATISAAVGTISASSTLTVTSATPTAITVTPANSVLGLSVTQQFRAQATFSDGTSQDITGVAQWHSSNSIAAPVTLSGLLVTSALGHATISASFGGVSGSTSLTVNASNVASMTITASNASIAQGTNTLFTAMGTYIDGSTHDLTRVVTWSSDNPAVLKIGPFTGIADGVTPGQANVTATLASLSATMPFTVTNATIVSLALTPKQPTIATGSLALFTAEGTFSDSSMQNLSSLSTWSSDNPSVATVAAVGSLGVANGVGAGTANITATFSYAGASATQSTLLTVSGAALVSLSLTPNTNAMAPGSAILLSANGAFTDGTVQRLNSLCTWSSSNQSVATVTQNGLVSAQSPGITMITAQDGSVTGSATVLVESSSLISIQISPQTASVAAGFSTQFVATGNFANGNTQNLTGFVDWASSNGGIATVSTAMSTAGQANGVQPGTTTISATFAGQTGTATLTVINAALAAITITPSTHSSRSNDDYAFNAFGTFDDGSTLDITRQVTWSSSTPSVATITSPGVAQGGAAGTASILAKRDGVVASINLTIP